eukprot:jgi/Botrbrau1/4540/Bobra.60_2s0028.1
MCTPLDTPGFIYGGLPMQGVHCSHSGEFCLLGDPCCLGLPFHLRMCRTPLMSFTDRWARD